MLRNTQNATNPAAASDSLATSSSSSAATPNQFFSFMLGSQADVLAHTLGFLSPRDAIAISLSSRTLSLVKSPSLNALWLRHIQRYYPRSVTQQPSQQAYVGLYQQDQALDFLLKSTPFIRQELKLKDKDWHIIQTVIDFKTSTFKQRADYLTQWNKDLGLRQLKDADHTCIRLQGLTELTPEVMQRLTAIYLHTQISLLGIANCYLPQLPEALINFLKACTQLQELSLHNNQLQSLPENLLQACTQLERLSLSSNKLKRLLENLLYPCARLKWLNLRDNQFPSLPENLLYPCTQLETLNLSSNKLKSLPENLLHPCTRLTNCYLTTNQLQRLPEMFFKNCPELLQLFLSDNRLQSLHAMLLEKCPKLQLLSVARNRLQSFPVTLLKKYT